MHAHLPIPLIPAPGLRRAAGLYLPDHLVLTDSAHISDPGSCQDCFPRSSRLSGCPGLVIDRCGSAVRTGQPGPACIAPASSVACNDARAVGIPPARAAAPAGPQADPVRRRRAELGRQGLGRGRRPLGADVSGRLRGGPAEPGHPDPLRGPERARGRAGRAHLQRLAGPGGADARARRAAVHGGRAPAGPRVRRARRELRHRAGLHQPADRAGPGRDPAVGGRPGRRTTRWCWPAGTRRSTPSRSPSSSTGPCWATASRPCWRSPT